MSEIDRLGGAIHVASQVVLRLAGDTGRQQAGDTQGEKDHHGKHYYGGMSVIIRWLSLQF